MSSSSQTELVGYAEVPEFHVALACRGRSGLETRAVVVGGHPQKRGKVIAASSSLRERGVVDGMLVAEVLSSIPEARWVRTDMRLAREVSGQLRALVREVVEAVEIDGLAGFYLRAPPALDEAGSLGCALTERVAAELNLPLRVGFAPVRFAARLAAATSRGAQPACIRAEALSEWLDGQPLASLPGVGPKTRSRLAELGVRDVPGLRGLGLERLEVLLGNHGRALWLLASGEDPKPLRVRRHPASLSRELAVDDPGGDPRTLAGLIDRLADSLENALRREGLRAGRIALRLSGPRTRTLTRSATLDHPTDRAAELATASRELLERLVLPREGFQRLALVLRRLEASGAEDRQLDLFER